MFGKGDGHGMRGRGVTKEHLRQAEAAQPLTRVWRQTRSRWAMKAMDHAARGVEAVAGVSVANPTRAPRRFDCTA